jgi:hypothetical protein
MDFCAMARTLLAQAVETEVAGFIAEHADRRAMVEADSPPAFGPELRSKCLGKVASRDPLQVQHLNEHFQALRAAHRAV